MDNPLSLGPTHDPVHGNRPCLRRPFDLGVGDVGGGSSIRSVLGAAGGGLGAAGGGVEGAGVGGVGAATRAL
jgi:hypothetical protein